jgi:protein-S-isoprenylcysteine O-methyltransferase Ste14
MIETIRVINALLLLCAIGIFIAFVINSIVKRIDVLGNPPINRVVFLTGKIANFTCWILFAYKCAEAFFVPIEFPLWQILSSTIFLFASCVYMSFSFLTLGDLNRFGVSGEKTKIVSTGIYSLSRNPMYVGFYLLNASSMVFFPHPVNIALGIAGIAIHHLIVLGEERHMAKVFGEEWEDYRKRVRRYV